MENNFAEETYRIWAHDNQIYGPVSLPVLIQWVQEAIVVKETWIYLERRHDWRRAEDIEPLRAHLPPGEATAFLHQRSFEGNGITPQELRQVEILASLPNPALAHLIRMGELECLGPEEVVLKKDEPGDALFFVLSGSLRARLMVGYEDQTLARIVAGEVFGEMAMLTQSPRSADVISEGKVRLLRLSAEAFRHLIQENPEAAAPMLFAIARTMASRIQDHNGRFKKEVASEFLWR